METAANKIYEKFSKNLSIIIPSYKSKFLDQAIKSAKVFEPLEIIVIDTSPYKPKVKGVKLHYQKERLNAAAARNKGAELANGEMLLFIDSDVILKKKTNLLLKDKFQIKKIILFAGYMKKTRRE